MQKDLYPHSGGANESESAVLYSCSLKNSEKKMYQSLWKRDETDVHSRIYENTLSTIQTFIKTFENKKECVRAFENKENLS